MKKSLKILKNPHLAVAGVVTLVAVVGTGVVIFSKAATPVINAEPETGNITAPAASVSDTTSSNGGYLKFGAAANPPTPTPPTPTPPTPPTGSEAPVGPTGTWTRTFTDEFNGTAVDKTKWATNWFGGTNMNGYQKLAGNVTISGGSANLALSADKAGSILTSNPNNGGGISGGYQFGINHYVEARILFPGTGTTVYNWPAWWTNGQSWPGDGEVDIFEVLGGKATSNYHYGSGGGHVANNSGTIAGTWGGAYHTYGLLRESGKNTIYWDGKVIRTYTSYDNGAPHYFILTNGDGHGSVTGEASKVKVDYVRAWRK